MDSVSSFGVNTTGFTLPDLGQFGQKELSQKNQFPQSSISLASQYEKISAASSLQKDITLETAEGDTVTISYQKDTAFLVEKYDAVYHKNSLQQSKNGVLRQQQWAQVYSEIFAYSQEEQFSLAISGDLNEDEQRDIRYALTQIDKLMMDAMSGGDLFVGAQSAAGIIGLENISAVEADYSYRSLVTIEEVVQANSITNYSGDGAPMDSLGDFFEPVSPTSSPSSLLSPPLSPSSLAAVPTPMARLQELIDEMAQIVEKQLSDKKMPAEKFKLPVEQLFADHIEQLNEVEGDGSQLSFVKDMFRFLGDGLLQKIESMGQESP